MRTITLAAIAAFTLGPIAAAHAQGQPGILRPSADEEIKVTAVGRVQSELTNNVFTLQVKNLVYRVSFTSGVNRSEVRRGDRVRVTGEIGTEADRILADQVVVVDRGRPSRTSTVRTARVPGW
jgi:translation initiation factor IF-1